MGLRTQPPNPSETIENSKLARSPLVTVVIPSLNQGAYLEATLTSVIRQGIKAEIFLMDAGSTDETLAIIRKYEHLLTGWRSRPDNGQSAAINEGIALGTAPYVCWLNSDDFFLPNGLQALLNALESFEKTAFSYGNCWVTNRRGITRFPYLTLPFSARLFANFCFICQPGTLIRREAWMELGGLDQKLDMAMDYDLWWRLYTRFGSPAYCKRFVAATRSHVHTKTRSRGEDHYLESMDVVEKHWGKVPLKWRLMFPLMKRIRRTG
jgi:glycosyltransferase involved in cell wall biosynthesis